MSGKKTPQSPFPSSNIFFGGGGGGSLPSPAAVAAAAAAAVSAPPPPLPYPSFPLATQAPWAMNNILAPNHPCLQVPFSNLFLFSFTLYFSSITGVRVAGFEQHDKTSPATTTAPA